MAYPYIWKFQRIYVFLISFAIPADLARVKRSELGAAAIDQLNFWVYGFMCALMDILTKHPELNFPQDLANIIVVKGTNCVPAPSDWIEKSRIVPASKMKTSGILRRHAVFFVDEFTAYHCISHEKLALFRRLLLNLQAHVIVASTDSTAVNMLHADAATVIWRNGDGVFVRLSVTAVRS